jgi:hypothetical protein
MLVFMLFLVAVIALLWSGGSLSGLTGEDRPKSGSSATHQPHAAFVRGANATEKIS